MSRFRFNTEAGDSGERRRGLLCGAHLLCNICASHCAREAFATVQMLFQNFIAIPGDNYTMRHHCCVAHGRRGVRGGGRLRGSGRAATYLFIRDFSKHGKDLILCARVCRTHTNIARACAAFDQKLRNVSGGSGRGGGRARGLRWLIICRT